MAAALAQTAQTAQQSKERGNGAPSAAPIASPRRVDVLFLLFLINIIIITNYTWVLLTQATSGTLIEEEV